MTNQGIKKETTVPATPTGLSTLTKTTVITRTTSATMLLHLIEDVLGMKPGSPIHMSLEYEGADTLVLFMNFTNQEIDNYEVEDGIKLPKKDKKLLKNLLSFVKYHHKRNNQFNWWSLEPADLDAFLMDIAPNLGSGPGDDKITSAVSKFHSNLKLDNKQ